MSLSSTPGASKPWLQLNREECKVNIYQRKYGCENRQAYLIMLSEDMGIPLCVVCAIADSLGPNEDFDGLVSILEDYEEVL